MGQSAMVTVVVAVGGSATSVRVNRACGQRAAMTQ